MVANVMSQNNRNSRSKGRRSNRQESHIHGVLNINKPAGMTSHDVVDRVRKAGQISRVGHTGTLDPMATGVLPICVGRATKIQRFMIAQDKEYVVDMKLGMITDSQDSTGEVLEEQAVGDLSESAILDVLNQFIGEQQQMPPMISAKHHQGQRLYKLARKGVEVEREPCTIIVHELELLAVQLPIVRFRVVCGKGTYIRTLCHDIGQTLGPGGVMNDLTRTRCGSFHIDDSVPLDDLQQPSDVQSVISDLNTALSALPSVSVAPPGKAAITNGRPLQGSDIIFRQGEFEQDGFVRIIGRNGSLLGIGQATMPSKQLDDLAGNLRVVRPVKIFQT